MNHMQQTVADARSSIAEVRWLLQLHKVLAKGKGAGGYEVLWRGTKKPRPK